MAALEAAIQDNKLSNSVLSLWMAGSGPAMELWAETIGHFRSGFF